MRRTHTLQLLVLRRRHSLTPSVQLHFAWQLLLPLLTAGASHKAPTHAQRPWRRSSLHLRVHQYAVQCFTKHFARLLHVASLSFCKPAGAPRSEQGASLRKWPHGPQSSWHLAPASPNARGLCAPWCFWTRQEGRGVNSGFRTDQVAGRVRSARTHGVRSHVHAGVVRSWKASVCSLVATCELAPNLAGPGETGKRRRRRALLH